MKKFGTLLASISGRFVQAPLGEMDEAIGDALAEVSLFAAVERSHVYLFDGDREVMNEIARWQLGDGERQDEATRSISVALLPYYAQTLFSGREVVFADPIEIPPSAVADRAFLAALGVRSGYTIPLTSAGETIGTFTLTTLTHVRAWSDDDAAMLRSIANVFAAALARRESERKQLQSVRFSSLVTSLLSRFMNLPADSLDEGVEQAIETIVRFVDADRGAIYILDESQEFAVLRGGWWAPDAVPLVDSYQRIDATPDTPYGAWIHSDQPHLILNAAAIASIRPDAEKALRQTGLGTVVNLPLVIAGRRIGWFGVGAKVPRVNWDPAELRSLGLAANALANMYSRRQEELERRRHERFEDTLSRMAAEFIKSPLPQLRTGIEEIIDLFGHFARSDRAAVLLIDESDETASTYYEWIGIGDPAPVRGFPVRAAPWFHEQLTSANGPWFMYVEDFPPSDQLAAVALEAIGIHTLLNCPIGDGEHLYGYASIGYRQARHRPASGTVQVLALAAGIISSALTRARLEGQALQQREALERAMRLSSLGQLTTGIAHELNQPLAAIANYSQACLRWLEAPKIDRPALGRVFQHISEEAIRAGDIIHNLRNHVRGGPARRRAASLGQILDDAHLLFAGTARDHEVSVVIDHTQALPKVCVEPKEIEQVVINVVQNSIDSIAATSPATREVTIRTRRDHGFALVEISDTGAGFGTGNRKRIFDQFYTTKPGGLGLGLSISRALIEANGGTMEASDAEPGATMVIRLPLLSAGRSRRDTADKDAVQPL